MIFKKRIISNLCEIKKKAHLKKARKINNNKLNLAKILIYLKVKNSLIHLLLNIKLLKKRN